MYDESMIIDKIEFENSQEDIPHVTKGFFDFCRKDDLWEIIEKSKENTHLNPRLQYNNLIKILKDYPLEEIKAFKATWDDIIYEYRERGEGLYRRLYELMKFEDSDVFYFDFNNWLVAQGKELFDLYRKNGAEAIIFYIDNNNIKKEDYTFECMYYVFDIFDVYTNNNNNYIKYAVMEEEEGCASNFARLLQDFNMEIKIERNTNQRTGEIERYEKYFVVFHTIQDLMEFRNRLGDIDIKIMNKYTDFGDNISVEPTILICNDYLK